MNYSLFISCPKGLEYLLETEVRHLGLHVTKVNPQGVFGEGTLVVIYQICLWSRLANRVQIILFSGQGHDENNIRQLCSQFHWSTVFSPDKSLAIEFHGSSDHIRNTMYGAQVVKDAIVDYFRHTQGVRPNIDKGKPQILLHAYLKNEELTLSFDVTGYSLHQRGYRIEGGPAPLKENVAAALLIRAHWPQLAQEGYALQDPFCGSGTLVIEAAMMAAHIAPGLIRQDQSLQYWAENQPTLWEKLRNQALAEVKPMNLHLLGTDADSQSIARAKINAEAAGVLPLVQFAVKTMKDCTPESKQGLLVCNPPYGERLGEVQDLIPLYQQLGSLMHSTYQGWQAAVLTSNPMLAKSLGLSAHKQYTLYNGALECKLYCLDISPQNSHKNTEETLVSGNAQMLYNRLVKNQSHLKKWAKKNEISCYRLYDADLPEYAFAMDVYNNYIVLQEYAAPASIPQSKVQQRALEVSHMVHSALGFDKDKIINKVRQPQKGKEQYNKLADKHRRMVVTEGKTKLLVNLYDYLDTGLFIDHRPLRLELAKLAPGTRFLNCFCYTATASVHAALAGALTTNVDLSNTYLAWAEDNFRLNHLDLNRHQFIQYDCRKWLALTKDRFDVIFLDPPSFSNSKRMEDTLDVQRDQVALITAAMQLLSPGGILYFSTNYRSFKLDPKLQESYLIKNISAQTIDLDFQRNPKIHHCFKITLPKTNPCP